MMSNLRLITLLLLVVGAITQDSCPNLEGLTGEIVTANDETYNSSRLDWNQAASPVTPCVIVFCQDTQDVVNAVTWAINNDIEISVRSGRHSYEGFSLGNGIIIDVSRMKYYNVDSSNAIASFQPGLKLIEVTWILYQMGFMLPAGFKILHICSV